MAIETLIYLAYMHLIKKSSDSSVHETYLYL